jgi:type I restriction enzyme S subunit
MTKTSQTKFKETELGEIPEDWENIVLRNLIEEVIDNRGKTPPLSKDGHEMIEVNAIKDDFVAPDYSVIRKFVDDDTYKNWFRGHIEVGDVLVSTVGTIGNISLIKEKRGVVAQNVIALRPKNRLDSSYLYYYLKSPNQKNELRNLNIGGVQPSIKVPHLLNLQITVPPLPEQQKIAEVLGALDEKIELNRKMNKTLESLAQAIFKKWFIDDANPNWETKKLGDVVRIKYGKNLPTTKLQESGYPVFGGNGQIGFFDKYLYELPQVLVACRGAASGKVNFSLPKSFVTNNSLILEYDNILNYEFLKYFALNADFYSCVSGSAQPQITIESLDGYEIMMPSKEIIYKFGQVAEPITQKILLNDNEINTLSQIRDSLLPRLMSGKLRVK